MSRIPQLSDLLHTLAAPPPPPPLSTLLVPISFDSWTFFGFNFSYSPLNDHKCGTEDSDLGWWILLMKWQSAERCANDDWLEPPQQDIKKKKSYQSFSTILDLLDQPHLKGGINLHKVSLGVRCKPVMLSRLWFPPSSCCRRINNPPAGMWVAAHGHTELQASQCPTVRFLCFCLI